MNYERNAALKKEIPSPSKMIKQHHRIHPEKSFTSTWCRMQLTTALFAFPDVNLSSVSAASDLKFVRFTVRMPPL